MKPTALALLVLTTCDPEPHPERVRSIPAESGGTEAGDGLLRWAVLDAGNAFVGWLDAPSPSAVFDHSDVFAEIEQGSARTLFLEREGYGFFLTQSGPAWTHIGHDDVLFTNPDCSGVAMDFAAHDAAGVGLGAAGCDGVTLAALPPEQVPLGTAGQFQQWTAANWPGVDGLWPGAEGQIVTTRTHGRWYHLPSEQPWPEVLVAKSLRALDGSCVGFVSEVEVCAIRLLDTDYVPDHPGPYSLVQLPWE